MQAVTITQITAPEFQELIESSLQKILNSKEKKPQPEPETLLTVQEAAKFLSLSVPTIYGLISKGELPVIKRSKRCYFSNIELMEYMKAGRRKTAKEIEQEADTYLSTHKKTR